MSVAVLLDNFISASANMEAEERLAAAERQSRCGRRMREAEEGSAPPGCVVVLGQNDETALSVGRRGGGAGAASVARTW